MTVIPIRIQSGASSMTKYRTFCCYGDTRVGKTRFMGTFPNVVVIADASERGWVTMDTMPPDALYHPGQGPIILPVADQADMIYALSVAERWVYAGYIDTVGIDSLTFYAESWFQAQWKKMVAVMGDKADTRSLYAALANHLSDTRQQIHRWPCNVVWTALAAPPDDDNPGGPMVSGKSRQRFPAGCDHILYHRKWTAQDPDTKEFYEVFEARTKAFGKYLGGGRDNGMLPDPLNWPTFRLIAEHLNLPEFPPKLVPDSELTAAVQAMPSAMKAPAPQATKSAIKPPVRPPVATPKTK